MARTQGRGRSLAGVGELMICKHPRRPVQRVQRCSVAWHRDHTLPDAQLSSARADAVQGSPQKAAPAVDRGGHQADVPPAYAR